jgi:hypothetical protein
MANVTIKVSDDLFARSVTRLRGAGVKDPEALLALVLEAAAEDMLQTMGGSGPIPSALNDLRAGRLLEVCTRRGEILSDEVVAVLFRVMPSTAAGITRRMQATYEEALETPLTANMRARARLSTPLKEEHENPKHRVRFSSGAAYQHAVKLIAARGLLDEVSTEPGKRTIEFDQAVKVKENGRDVEIKIAKDVLGVP